MENARKWIARLLLAFVLVSVGFAIGRETAPTPDALTPEAVSSTAPGEVASSAPVASQADTVMVYYLHSTFRCPTCESIESTTGRLIREEFATALESGRLQWKTVDYLKNDALAERYDVRRPMAVVARFRGGREVSAVRLDRVMELAQDREALQQYVREAIAVALKEAA